MTDGPPPPPPDGYASDPILGMLWSSCPDYTGNLAKKNESGSGDAPPAVPPIIVDLAALRATEQATLNAVQSLVFDYNELEAKVQMAIGSPNLFGQQATYNIMYDSGETNRAGDPIPPTLTFHQDTDLQNAATEFAAQINPIMTRVLRQVADAVETAGIFVAMLDKTGQMYTAADKESVFPAPSPVRPMLANPHDNPAAARPK